MHLVASLRAARPVASLAFAVAYPPVHALDQMHITADKSMASNISELDMDMDMTWDMHMDMPT